MSTIRQYCDAPIFFGGNGPGDDNVTVKADRRLPSVTVQVQHMEAGSEMEPAFCGYCKSIWRVLLAFLTGLLTQTYFPSSCYSDSSFLIDLFWFKTILGIPRLGSSPKKQETAVKSPPIIVKACVVLRLKCFPFSNKPTWEDKPSLFSETVNNAAVFREEAVFYLNPLLLSSCRKQRRAQKAGNLIF